MTSIFADLLILPILNIYHKYYGTRMMLVLLGTFYVSMVCAGYFVELLFGATNLIPTQRNAKVMLATNISFLVVAAVLIVRFVTTGGVPMLRMMGGPPHDEPAYGGKYSRPADFVLRAPSACSQVASHRS